jgi:hypothetical protein
VISMRLRVAVKKMIGILFVRGYVSGASVMLGVNKVN